VKRITYSAPSVRKAFKILHLIADSPEGLGVSELSKKLKIGKSTVHGITAALEDLGVLVRDTVEKKYNLGSTLLELSRKAYARMELRQVAQVPMEKLMEKVGESVFLGTLNGDHITILNVVESRNELKITSPPGTSLPLLAGATGRVFMAQLEEKKVRKVVQEMGLARYTPKSVTDGKQFLKDVLEVKEKGYAVDDESYLLGVRAIAAPIPMPSFPPAAIWVVGFTSTLDDRKLVSVTVEIQRSAQEITQALHHHVS